MYLSRGGSLAPIRELGAPWLIRKYTAGNSQNKSVSAKVIVGIANHNHYAKIHNEGGKILITPKMRRFFWAKFKETGKEYWKGLALTKNTFRHTKA